MFKSFLTNEDQSKKKCEWTIICKVYQPATENTFACEGHKQDSYL